MAYQVDKFNGTFLVSVADGTVDTTTDLRLLGKNYAGYGEVQNENFLHLLESFANTSPPPKAINGQIWFDSASKRLKYYDADNTKWRTTGGLEVSSTAPVKMNTGDFWYDTSADQLYSWNGNAFVLIGPQPTVGGSQTATSVAIVKGTDGLNYNIVKLIAGAGDTVAIISNDEFTIDSILNPVPGFSAIKKGVTLVNTDSNGISTTDNIFWGTASNAARLGGVLASEFVQKGASAFTSQVAFTNAGYTVGTPGNNLAVFIELGAEPVLESRNSARITVRIRESVSVAHDIMEFIAPTLNPGAAIPGITSTFDLGTQINKWKTVYADDFSGALTGNVIGNTTGAHKGNITASDDSTAYSASTKIFTGVEFVGIHRGNVIGDVTGTSSNAFTLNNLQGSVATANSTVVIRDSSGNINANSFVGTASRSDLLLVAGLGYQTASAAPTANTIVVRDSSGTISANSLNGTATAANSLQADGSAYVTASSAALGNTIVVRDGNGNINVNGILGAATQANQLQVDGSTYRLASASAIANTVAVRDADGVLRSSSIQNTPIGTVSRAAGAFTTLSSNGATTVTASTASTSTSTGALVVTGGVGVGGIINATGFAGSLTGSMTGTVSSTAITINREDAFNTTTPGFIQYGLHLQGQTTADFANGITFNGGTGSSSAQAGIYVQGSGAYGTKMYFGTTDSYAVGSKIRMNIQNTGQVQMLANIPSSSTTTGTLVVTGGMGVSGNLYSTAHFETSSIAFKENVNPLENALASIMKLTGVTYDRTDTKVEGEAGLIAEEVNKVLPNLVAKDENGNPYGIAYSKLTAYLVECIKELKSEIEDLKMRK